jgi:hypothetical protein
MWHLRKLWHDEGKNLRNTLVTLKQKVINVQ